MSVLFFLNLLPEPPTPSMGRGYASQITFGGRLHLSNAIGYSTIEKTMCKGAHMTVVPCNAPIYTPFWVGLLTCFHIFKSNRNGEKQKVKSQTVSPNTTIGPQVFLNSISTNPIMSIYIKCIERAIKWPGYFT